MVHRTLREKVDLVSIFFASPQSHHCKTSFNDFDKTILVFSTNYMPRLTYTNPLIQKKKSPLYTRPVILNHIACESKQDYQRQPTTTGKYQQHAHRRQPSPHDHPTWRISADKMQAQSAMTCISAASSFSIRSRSLGPACATEIWFEVLRIRSVGRTTASDPWCELRMAPWLDLVVVGIGLGWAWFGVVGLYVPVRKDSVHGTDLASLSLGSGD